jgi:hypothetical protein
VERAGPERRPDPAALLVIDAAVQGGGGNAARLGRRDLVLHEGDQRRDHHREAAQHERGNLEADGLSATGGEDRQGVGAREDRPEHGHLGGTKICVAEVEPEKAARLVERRGHPARWGCPGE